MLTERQKKLLTALAGTEEWSTSAALAARLGVSDKLVKQEVASIRAQLGGACDIESRTRKGYRLVYLAPQVRAQLGEGLVAHGGHHSVNRRYALVYLCLLFQEEYVSTGWLAERLFSSRAAVADQLEVVRYRVERLPNVELTVSRRYGFKLQLCEAERRHEASKWLRPDCLSALFTRAGEQGAFARHMERSVARAREELAPLVREGRLSGEDVQRLGYYMAVSVERTRTGHALTCEDDEVGGVVGPPEPCAIEAARALVAAAGKEEGFESSLLDVPVLAALIQDALVVERPTAEGAALAEELAETAALWLGGAQRTCSEQAKHRLACELTGLLRRMRRGHPAFNYRASETVARYPFESCLATWFLRERMEMPVPKAEMAFLALALADVAQDLRPQPRVILVSGEAPVFTRHLCQELSRPLGVPATSVDVLPVDQADDELLAGYDVVVTTSGLLAARMPDAVRVPALPGGGELRRVEQELADQRARIRDARAEKLVRSIPASDGAAGEILVGLPALLEEATALHSGSPAVVLTAYRRLCIVDAGAEESSIVMIAPEDDLIYQHKRYRELVYARWGAADHDAYGFFEVLTRVLSRRPED